MPGFWWRNELWIFVRKGWETEIGVELVELLVEDHVFLGVMGVQE
jgi:hypothetical protein